MELFTYMEESLYGENRNDTCFGGEGNDVAYGDYGDDILHGESGNDILDGGSGNDYLDGGNENDTYFFGKNYGTDIGTAPVQEELTEEERIQANADILSDLYTEDSLSDELFVQNDTSTLADISDTVSFSEESKEVADQTDIQAMILTENMSAFGEEENVSARIHISEIAQETSNTNQLFVDYLAS